MSIFSQIDKFQVRSGIIDITHIDTSTTNKALITKVVAGNNVTISSTGTDSGSGSVTINAPIEIKLNNTTICNKSILNFIDSDDIIFSLNSNGDISGNVIGGIADPLVPTTNILLTGLLPNSGTITEADTILRAFNKIIGNKDSSNGYPGLSLYKINFKNEANTFTSFFTNQNTASHTYTFPNRTDTIATLQDLTNGLHNISHTGLIFTEGTNIDQVKTISITLTLINDWQDSGICHTDLETGTYIVQLIANDIAAGGTNQNEYYSGIMSWYNGITATSLPMPTDEVPLHRAGGYGEGGLYLRTFRTDINDPHNLKLQIYANHANTSAANYVFKFRRII